MNSFIDSVIDIAAIKESAKLRLWEREYFFNNSMANIELFVFKDRIECKLMKEEIDFISFLLNAPLQSSRAVGLPLRSR